MVGMAMREEDCVHAGEFFRRVGAARVGHNPGIDQSNLPGGSGERKSAVSQIGDVIAFELEHKKPFSKWAATRG